MAGPLIPLILGGARIAAGLAARQGAARGATAVAGRGASQAASQAAKQRARNAATIEARKAAGRGRPKGMASPDVLRAQRARDLNQAANARRTANTVPKDANGLRALMRPGNAPTNRPVLKPADGGLRSGARDQRALSGKVTTRNIGPKPKRGDYKTDRSYQTALKKWETKRATPPSTPAATTPKAPTAPKGTPRPKKPSAVAKQDAAAASRAPSSKAPVKKPSSKGKEVEVYRGPASGAGTKTPSGGAIQGRDPVFLITRPVQGAGKSTPKAAIGPGRGNAVVKRQGSAVASRGGKGGVVATTGKQSGGGAAGGAVDRSAAEMAKKVGGYGTTAAGLAFTVNELRKMNEASERPVASGGSGKPAAGTPSSELKDKYGRKISREEYNRREKFRQKLASAKTKKQAEKLKKAEGKRRSSYRKGEASQQFGAEAATKKVRNQNVRAWASVRDENRSKRAKKEGTSWSVRDGRRFR